MDLTVARKIKKLTQWDLKKKTGINQTKISLIERGYVVPTKKEKFLIAKALGFHIDEIKWPIDRCTTQNKLPINAVQTELPFKGTDQ